MKWYAAHLHVREKKSFSVPISRPSFDACSSYALLSKSSYNIQIKCPFWVQEFTKIPMESDCSTHVKPIGQKQHLTIWFIWKQAVHGYMTIHNISLSSIYRFFFLFLHVVPSASFLDWVLFYFYLFKKWLVIKQPKVQNNSLHLLVPLNDHSSVWKILPLTFLLLTVTS
jgi:hypothetical protein